MLPHPYAPLTRACQGSDFGPAALDKLSVCRLMVGEVERLRVEAKQRLVVGDDPSTSSLDAGALYSLAHVSGRATRSKSRAKPQVMNEFSDPSFAALADHVALSLGLRSADQVEAWKGVLT